jgi:hypothetical protein
MKGDGCSLLYRAWFCQDVFLGETGAVAHLEEASQGFIGSKAGSDYRQKQEKSKEKGKPSFYPCNLPLLCALNGGAGRDRTDDLLNAIQALSQLSYSPTQIVHND